MKMRKHKFPLNNTRALSPIFATLMLAAIVIIFGTVAYYYASNVTTNATNEYVKSVGDSKVSISERLGFENVVYTQNPVSFRIYVINCGSMNNVQLNSLYVYNSNGQLVGYNATLSINSKLKYIENGTEIESNSLGMGREGYFDAKLTRTGIGAVSTLPLGVYRINLITKGESTFDYQIVIS
jgi:hypothetical protein